MLNINQLDRRNIRLASAKTHVSHEVYIADFQRALRRVAPKCLWVGGKRGNQLKQQRESLKLNIRQHQIALTQ